MSKEEEEKLKKWKEEQKKEYEEALAVHSLSYVTVLDFCPIVPFRNPSDDISTETRAFKNILKIRPKFCRWT